MSLTILPGHAYAFLSGLYIGKFTNIFSDVVITGLVLYIVTPEIFTEERLTKAKRYFWSWFNYKKTVVLSDDQIKMIKNHSEHNNKTVENILNSNKSPVPFRYLPPLPKIELMNHK